MPSSEEDAREDLPSGNSVDSGVDDSVCVGCIFEGFLGGNSSLVLSMFSPCMVFALEGRISNGVSLVPATVGKERVGLLNL